MMRSCIFIALLMAYIPNSYAFYVSEHEHLSQEARGLLLLGSGEVNHQATQFASTRLMYDMDTSNWHVEYQQLWQQTYAATHTYQTQADRLNISYSNDTMYIKAGRQAINLSTTFFFSPNDFFAPFTIQSLNRDFKQGVDAINAEWQVDGFMGELSTLSLILVNNQDENLNTSSILRFESTLEHISWMVFAGNINPTPLISQQVFGGSLQADLLGNLGIRAEGHISKQAGQQSSEWVLGLDQRLNPNITWSAEWFHHGEATIAPHLPYAGKQYLALGLNYQFTPLLLANLSLVKNMDDQSQLNTAYLNYSLSDESTLNLSVLYPSDKRFSEFSLYPKVYALDYQIYF